MELGTFGAVLSYALDIEQRSSAFFEEIVDRVVRQDARAVFEDIMLKGQRRIRNLMRVRRENVTEMILEPITGLDSDDFPLKTGASPEADDSALIGIAAAVQDTLKEFFTAAASKISFLPEASYEFEDLASEHADDAVLLRGLT
ncbi:MAG: hypothetical protein JSW61_05890 [Candidatus Thorarchaeota archaeon]|nr:MAG: hypothetical protein JSW61_05890 [Candidatus Thorarchaeota archaeon]